MAQWEFIEIYRDEKKRIFRVYAITVFLSALIGGLAREDDFHLQDPFGVVGGQIHQGYTVTLGAIPLFALAVWYSSSLNNLLKLRDTVSELPQTEPMQEAKAFLLQYPFEFTANRYLRAVVGVFPLLVIACSYVIAFDDYLSLRTKDAQSAIDMWFKWPSGDRPTRGDHWPWIYPPVQTWVMAFGLIGIALMGWVIFRRQTTINHDVTGVGQ